MRRATDILTTDRALKAVRRLRRWTSSGPRCIVISAMPKSGSTFLSNALTALTGYEHGYAACGYFNIEQELYLPRLIDNYGRGVVVQQHFRANVPNLQLLQSFGLRPVVQVRNVFDALVSLRDHMHQESIGNLPTLYPSSRFRELDPVLQFDYLVDFAAPWYLGYYYSWLQAEAERKVELLWVRYEQATADWGATIARVLQFHGIEAVPGRIDEVLAGMNARPRLETRLNVGVAGRGASALTAGQRERVEALARYYPGTDFSPIGLRRPVG